ncbi:hypothetical protein ACFY4C_32975 [Actinomadura viridis]
MFEDDGPAPGATGMIAGFGPGITAEMAVGRWTIDIPGEVDRASLTSHVQ